MLVETIDIEPGTLDDDAVKPPCERVSLTEALLSFY
jgi:hypothetical protein